MELQADFSELLKLFNAQGVEYLIVGGYAMAWHGSPRYTGDIDLFVRPTTENAQRVLSALDDFGFGSLDLAINDFNTEDRVVQLGMAPWRIDLLTSIDGLTWDEAIDDAETTNWDPPSPIIARAALIANKQATGRDQDRVDVKRLLGEED
jgi:hypothetical protein